MANIVHVVETLDTGGLERVVVSLAARQQLGGHRVRIVNLVREGALAHEARSRGIPVVVIGKRRGPDIRAIRRIASEVRAARGEVIHTHNAMAHYYTVAATIRGSRPFIINTRHGMGNWNSATRTNWLYRLALRRTANVVSVCEAAEGRFLAAGIVPSAKSRVVPNGIELASVHERTESARALLFARYFSHLPRADDEFLVGSVGRLHAVKRFDVAIRAVQRLRASGKRVLYLLVGDGAERERLEDLVRSLQVSEWVRFAGERNDVAAVLAGLDAFVLPSASEGCSIALLEALAAGVPAIATNVGGNPEIIGSSERGVLVPPDDDGALAAAVQSLAADPRFGDRLAREGRRYVDREFSVDRMHRAYSALYGIEPDPAGALTHADPVRGTSMAAGWR